MATLENVLAIKTHAELKSYRFKFSSYPDNYFYFLTPDPVTFCSGMSYIHPELDEEVELVPEEQAIPTFSQQYTNCVPIASKYKTFTTFSGDRDPFELTTQDQKTAIFLANTFLEKGLEIDLLRKGWVFYPELSEIDAKLRNNNGEPLFRSFIFKSENKQQRVFTTTEPQTKLEFLAFFATRKLGLSMPGALNSFEVKDL